MKYPFISIKRREDARPDIVLSAIKKLFRMGQEILKEDIIGNALSSIIRSLRY